MKRLTEEETNEPNESTSDSDVSIHHIKEIKKINEMNKHFTATVQINGVKKEFIIDTGSSVSIMPSDERIMKATEIQKITNRYQDVNKNEVKFRGKIPVNIEYENNKQKMEIFITERTDITPLLGMDWMKKFKLTIGKIQLAENNQSEREKVFTKFPDLFENNETIKDTEIKIQLKPGHQPIKQKAGPVPLHLQKDVEQELERLIKSGHLEKVNNVDEDCFVSPVVITVKSDKSVKIALDSRKLNDSCIKMRPHMPNMEELLYQISIEITRDRTAQLFMSKIDLDYAYGQMKLSDETSRQCVFALTGGNFSGYYRFKKGFYRLADIPTIFQEKIDRTLEYCTPAWLDDIIVVTRGNKQDHEGKLFDILNKLEKAGYRASRRKSEFFLNRTKWLGNEIDENGIKPNEEKIEAIQKLNPSKNTKELKSFLGAIQYMAKFLPKLSERTDRLRKLLKKNEPWNWEEEKQKDFEKIKQMLTEGPCLAHYAKDKDNIVTTDASTTGLGITLWQKQDDGNKKPIAYGSRYLNETEKKYSIGELELLAVVWGLEKFRFYLYGKKVYLYTDHQALEPLIKQNRCNKQYSARLTRWLERLTHFDISIQHIASSNLKFTDYLSRNPVGGAAPEENYEEEYVINILTEHAKLNLEHGRLFADQSKHDKHKTELNKPTTSGQSEISTPKSSYHSLQQNTEKMDRENFYHRGATREIMNIIRRRNNSPETKRLIDQRNALSRPGTLRRRNDHQTQRTVFAPSRPNKRRREEIAEIDAEIMRRANRLGGGYQPIQEEPEDNTEEGEINQEPEDTEEDSVLLRGDNLPIVDLSKEKH